jgi:hypothetical protein
MLVADKLANGEEPKRCQEGVRHRVGGPGTLNYLDTTWAAQSMAAPHYHAGSRQHSQWLQGEDKSRP